MEILSRCRRVDGVRLTAVLVFKLAPELLQLDDETPLGQLLGGRATKTETGGVLG